MRIAFLALVVLAASCAAPRSDVVLIGAVYPTGGGQGSGGVEELRGLRLAVEHANARGGVQGRRIVVRTSAADSPDAAPGAVRTLAAHRPVAIAGSYGSTISAPAAAEAARRRIPFWETGAVGELGMDARAGEWTFRVAPTGAMLGRGAVRFVADVYAPRISRDPASLRFAVAYVDDAYGRSVGLAAAREVRASGLQLARTIPYDVRSADHPAIAREIASARTDVLVVASYLEDAVAMRRALVDARVPLVAGIGTSSSYCHRAFGDILGDQAVGLFASDKPDGDVVRTDALSKPAAALLTWARDAYRERYGEPMPASALSGFAGGWALVAHVLPAARSLSPSGVAAAARTVSLERGSLPNGAGLAFENGTNVRASSVVWEWVAPRERAIVWPPAFATAELLV